MRRLHLALSVAWLATGAAASAQSTARMVVGADAGIGPQIEVRDGDAPVFSFAAYAPAFSGGVRVAVGDVNGDGTPDIVTGSGPGAGPHVKVFDGTTGEPVQSFFAFAVDFTGGIYVAAGDVNGDGYDDVIVGAGAGGGPHVKVFSGATQAPLADFLAFSPTFTGGVRVGAGDVDGDGKADLVIGAGPGGGEVKVLRGTDNGLIRSFLPYGSFTGGVYVAAGDVDGDGKADPVVGPDEGAAGHVKVFDGATGQERASFFAFGPSFTGGVRVATADVNGDQLADLLLSGGPGAAPTVRRLRGTDQASLGDWNAFTPSFTGGVFVGGQPIPTPEPAHAGAVAIACLALLRLVDSSRRDADTRRPS